LPDRIYLTPTKGGKVEIDLSDDQVMRMLLAAEKTSFRDFLFLCLIGAGTEGKAGRGLRIGEVVGVKKTTKYEAWKDPTDHSLGKEWRLSQTDLPGIYVGDLRDGSVWLKRKGGAVVQIQIPLWLYEKIALYSRGFNPNQKLFDFEERQGYDLVQLYARMAGIADWDKVHPHRLRHFFITRVHEKWEDLKTTQELAGHASPITTLRYIRKMTPERERAKLEQL
jgi:integrase